MMNFKSKPTGQAYDTLYLGGELRDWDIIELRYRMRRMLAGLAEDNPGNHNLIEIQRASARILAMGWHKKEPTDVVVRRIRDTLYLRFSVKETPLKEAVRNVLVA